jgi:hypothetical protein
MQAIRRHDFFGIIPQPAESNSSNLAVIRNSYSRGQHKCPLDHHQTGRLCRCGFQTRLYLPVIPANLHGASATTEHEIAAIESGATDASRPAGFIRACRLLPDGLWTPLQQGNSVPRTSRRSHPSTDEPSAHPWHQISNSSCTTGMHFQVNPESM